MAKKQQEHVFHIFYGWYVLAASFIILLLNSGARFIIGVMFKPMIAEFGWDRSTVSLAFFIFMAVYALCITITGKLYDLYGPKWVIIISSLFLLTGYSSLYFIHSFWQFVSFYSVISSAGLAGTSVPLFSAISSKWFEKNRGLAISLALAGNCLGQFILIPISTILILLYGWRVLCFWLGIIMVLINVVLAVTVIKGDPEDLGIDPYGHDRATNGEIEHHGLETDGPIRDLGLVQAMKTSSFWFFLFLMFVCGSGDFLVTTHLIPFVTDHGVSPVSAGNMLACLGLMSLAGILLAGPASDIIGNKTPIVLTFLLRVLLFIFILKYQNIVSFYIFSLFFGFSFLITAPLTPTLIGRLYGLSHVGILSGFITTIHHLGGGFWAYVGGLLFDLKGDYQLVFLLSAIMAFLAFFSGLMIREKRYNPTSL